VLQEGAIASIGEEYLALTGVRRTLKAFIEENKEAFL
jgi:hypothetical protein